MTAQEVWLVLCVSDDGQNDEETFAFSSFDSACKWAAVDKRPHVVYSRILDHPELAHMVTQ